MGLLRSKKVEDYFEAQLSKLRPGSTITFAIHLFFPQSQHLMVWRASGETVTSEFLGRYQDRGVTTVWVHKDDRKAFDEYMNPVVPADQKPELKVEVAQPPIDAPPPEPPKPEGPPPPRTEAGALMAETLKSEQIDEKQKAAIVAETAREVLSKAAQATTQEEQKKADQEARKTVQDVLDTLATKSGSLVAELWKLGDVDPDFDHAINVATYAVVFAMAFGRIDNELIADIALAGLLHDVGLTQVPATVTSTNWKSMDKNTLPAYAGHVSASVALIEKFGPEVPKRVRSLIHQHHEKFDGSGYPQGLQGFKVDDVAQLLSMADMVDSVGSGRWDGTPRTMRGTFDTINGLEKARSFPEYFNPEVFAAVTGWLRKNADSTSLEAAAKTVKEQAKSVIGSDAAA